MDVQTAAPRRIVVIGAGIVGACTARELALAGHEVTVLDAGLPGGEQAASYGNGAFISPASIVPMSVPGLWRKVPGYLSDREGPLTIRWARLPQLMPWLARFLLAGATDARLARTMRLLSDLVHDSPARHLAMAAAIGTPELIRQDGILYVYRNRAAFAAEGRIWELRRRLGQNWEELDQPALRAFAPMLSDRYELGIRVPNGAQCRDPGAYVRAILGDIPIRRVRATSFVGDRTLTAVRTEAGEFACDHAVIAAGMGSKHLAVQAGDRVPLEAERGYHVELPEPGLTLPCPIMPTDGKMANTMMVSGLRAAGQVELSHAEDRPDWRRVEILLRHLKVTYPDIVVDRASLKMWQGNRPSTPDGLPVIGPARRMVGVWHAFGHGHIGLNAAPATADLLTRMIDARPLPFDTAPFSARRFD